MADFFKDKIFHNTSLKVFSLVFALVFWIYVMDQENPVVAKTFRNVKVELLNMSSVEKNELLIMNNEEFFVDVTVEGRRDEVFKFNSSDLSLTANLIGYKSGINTIKINSDSSDSDVKIINQSMNEIKIEFENYVERSKPIKLEYTGSLPENYKITSSELAFNASYVSGASSKVNSVAAFAASYNIAGLKGSVSDDITIIPIDDDGKTVQGVTLDKKYVTLNLRIVKEKEVDVLVEFIDQTTEDYHVKTTDYYPKRVKIQGKDTLVDSVNDLTLEPIEIGDDLEVFSFDRDLILPPDISIAEGTGTINIFGEVEPIIRKEFVYIIDNITIMNLRDETETEIIDETPEITLQMTGPKSSIETIDKDNVVLLIDGSDFELGENSGEISVKFNDKSYAYELSQKTIQILLKSTTNNTTLEPEGN